AASDALRCEVGARLMPFEVPEWTRAIEQVRQTLGEDVFDAEWAAATSIGFDDAIDLGLGGAGAAPAAPARVTVHEPRPVMETIRPAPALEWPPADAALVVRALGQLEVRRDDRTLTNEDWTYAKPRELLLHLLVHRDGCTKEQIGLDLWPDASPARLRSSFHVTVHHLRRALGAAEWVAFDEGRYRFDTYRPFAWDVEQFEQCIEQARSLRNATAAADQARRIALLEAAVALYRGDFLDDAGFGDWTLEPRD